MSNPFRTEHMKLKGCRWEFGGVVGLSEKLVVFDGDSAVGVASDLSPRNREALADGMIELWQRFRSGEVHPDAIKAA